VGDENVGEREFALEVLQQEKNLRADGDIQSRDRLIGNDELGLEDEGAGDANPLPLPAGEFVGIPPQGVFI